MMPGSSMSLDAESGHAGAGMVLSRGGLDGGTIEGFAAEQRR